MGNLRGTAADKGRNRRPAVVEEKVAMAAIYGAGVVMIIFFCAFIGYILYTGRHSLNWQFITTPPRFIQAGGGIGPQLFNSFYLLFLSLLVSLPIGLGAGIYMAEYARPGRITDMMRLALDTLSSLPSIIVGLFGLLVFVQLTGWGFTLMSGAMALMIINLPVLTRVTEESIRAVPENLREGSLALGATHWDTIVHVLLPAAIPGLLSGVVLMAGRVFGEAAALLYTAGMSSPPLDFGDLNPFHASSPLNPFRPAETLAVYTWKVNSESLVPDARQIGDGAAAVLVLTVLGFNILARGIGRLLQKRTAGA